MRKKFVAAGWQSSFSHHGELSLDFKMKQGTAVCAARDGIVHSAREDSDRGGAKAEYMGNGNHVVIQHSDGSFAAVPTRFQTKKGIRYLRPGKFYKSIHPAY